MTPHAIEGCAANRLYDDMLETIRFWPQAVPLRERVLDRLADLMFCADDVLEMIATEAGGPLQVCEKPVRRAYDSINVLMKSLSD
jgi:hypothetical protein